MSIILLDRNIISDIELYNDGRPPSHIHVAREIDKVGNYVSPFLSILEGGLKRVQTVTEMYDRLQWETETIARFYRNAKTDSTYLKNNATDFVWAFAQEAERDMERFWPLVAYLQRRLGEIAEQEVNGSIRRADLIPIRREILEHAIDLGHPPSHPIVICGLACLHGNKLAARVLNPCAVVNTDKDRENAYNALLDLRKLTQRAYIEAISNRGKPRIAVDLLTRDKGLKNFAAQFRPYVSREIVDPVQEIASAEYTVNITPILFPELGRKRSKEKASGDSMELLTRDILDAVLKASLITPRSPLIWPGRYVA